MKRVECEFEAEVLAAVVQSAWPHGVGEDLRAHVRTCELCSDAAAVAGSLAVVREADRSVEIPSSGLVWWRVQLRMRREAAAAAERPIIAAQWVAFVCAVTLLVSWVASALTGLEWKRMVLSVMVLFAQHELLIAAMAVLLFGIPAAVYFAIGKE